MSKPAGPGPDESGVDSGRGFLARLQDWWRRRGDLDRLPPDELARVARELGMTVHELKGVMAGGPRSADLLYLRMDALELSRDAVESAAPGLMRDLQATCCACSEKARCQRDLAAHPDKAFWQDYCPNFTTLTSLSGTTRTEAKPPRVAAD